MVQKLKSQVLAAVVVVIDDDGWLIKALAWVSLLWIWFFFYAKMYVSNNTYILFKNKH